MFQKDVIQQLASQVAMPLPFKLISKGDWYPISPNSLNTLSSIVTREGYEVTGGHYFDVQPNSHNRHQYKCLVFSKKS